MKKLVISHLVVNGCSFAYGQGLAEPTEQSWPALLAKKLGVPLVNLALPGYGNEAIHRRTINYVYNSLNNNPFFIHAYTHSSRREIYVKTDDCHRPRHDFCMVSAGFCKEVESAILTQTDEYNLKLLEERKQHYWASINGLLDSKNISHLMSDQIPEHSLNVEAWLLKHNFNMVTELDNHPGRIKDLHLITEHLEKLPCGHETVEGNQAVAEYIWNEINKRYDTIEVADQPYKTLYDVSVIPDGMTWNHTFSNENVYYLKDKQLQNN